MLADIHAYMFKLTYNHILELRMLLINRQIMQKRFNSGSASSNANTAIRELTARSMFTWHLPKQYKME